jgi:hypothetical protein
MQQFRYVCTFVLFLFIVGLSNQAFAASDSFNFDGTLFDGAAPVAPGTSVKFSIYAPNGTCLLYEETQVPTVDQTTGAFSVKIGKAVGNASRTASDPGLSMTNVFQNGNSVTGALSCNYVPSPTDARLLRITVGASTVLSPDYALSAVPMAKVAESVNGLTKSNILQVNAGANLTQANVENIFTNYTELNNLVTGASTVYMKSGAQAGSLNMGTQKISNLQDPTAATDAATKNYADTKIGGSTADTLLSTLSGADSGKVMSWDGTKWVASSPGVINAAAVTNTPAGNIAATTVQSALAELDAEKLSLTGGSLTGSLTMNNGTTLVLRNAMPVRLYDGADTNRVDLRGPASVTTNYSLFLPVNAGNVGEVLQTDGTGVLSWVPQATPGAGSITLAELGPNAVNSSKVVDGSLVSADLADSAVTSAKILDSSIVLVDLADSSVNSAKIVDSSVASVDLADSAVTSAKISDGTIGTVDLAAGSISLSSTIVSGTLPIAYGGTSNSALSVANGGMIYTDGTKLMNSGAGTSGQVLQSNGAAAPSWVNVPANAVAKTGDTMTGALVNNTSSVSAALAVTQSGAGVAATFMGGNVGIGTTAPLGVLTGKSGSSGLPAVSGGNDPKIALRAEGPTNALDFGVNDTDGLAWMQARHRLINGTSARLSINPLGGVVQVGYNSTPNNNEQFMVFQNGTTDAIVARGNTGNLLTLENNSGTAFSVFKANGNVGIGTVSPSRPVDVTASGSVTYAANGGSGNTPLNGNTIMPSVRVFYPGSADNSGSFFEMAGVNAVGNSQNAYMGAVTMTGGGNYSPAIVIGHSTGANSYSERMRIDSSGNVGIGTTGPVAKLDINGSIKIGPNGTPLTNVMHYSAATVSGCGGSYSTATGVTCSATLTGSGVNTGQADTISCTPVGPGSLANAVFSCFASGVDTVTINVYFFTGGGNTIPGSWNFTVIRP